MGKYQMAPYAIPAERIPVKTLVNGVKMPGIDIGTFGSDHAGAQLVADTVREALRLDYRRLRGVLRKREGGRRGDPRGLGRSSAREELFIVGKLWNDKHTPADAAASCMHSVEDLRIGYMDAYLVHWPFPNYHAPGCDGDSRNPDLRPYFHDEFMVTWRALEGLADEGLIRCLARAT